MFHVEPGSLTPPPEALELFGDRLPLAELYVQSLATDGVERGIIGPREVPRLWERHILNCAVVEELIPEAALVVDIGSGGGLPGLPIAIARPDLRVALVEPMLRRTQYLADVMQSLGIDVEIVRGRAEQPGVIHEVGGCDVVTSRALAPLESVLRWSMPLLRQGGSMIALKGASAGDEIASAKNVAVKLHVDNLRVSTCGESVLTQPTTVVIGERGQRRHRR